MPGLFQHSSATQISERQVAGLHPTQGSSLTGDHTSFALTKPISRVRKKLNLYARPAFSILRRFSSASPFYIIASELYAYIRDNFLTDPYSKKFLTGIHSEDIDNLLMLARRRILLIEDMYILNKFSATPTSCLHIAEKYLTPPILMTIQDLLISGTAQDVLKMKEVKKLSRALIRWEDKQQI